MEVFDQVFWKALTTQSQRGDPMSKEQFTSKDGNLVQIDESQVRNHLDKVVRSTVEETLNGLLDAVSASALEVL